jgi:hypothetical protein
MLRRDANASFVKTGAWIFSRYRFQSGRSEAKRALNQGAYGRLLSAQRERPVLVLADEERRRRWWLFRDEFYWEDDGLNEREVMALALQRENQRERQVQRAVALMEGDIAAVALREPLSDAVKAFVWQRDGGRCVGCGARERLEFDHVIPLALGGSNTARNLQLLCESCNRRKGVSV